ncbi:Peptidase A22B signal peptide peptidase [Arabidopsis suecica]|uniref:Peptidase A22B signal peptide peptidase n=1 Tax=Arabidopsis suecica TaxID=45249 RepID=A0A8T2BIA7_ARASU|nr:Peptidase A22B signal peptide peptidase [Arabidopsis suecica]
MVSVAKSFDAPIKLLFPTGDAHRPYSMLVLGDIVIPGIFVAVAISHELVSSSPAVIGFLASHCIWNGDIKPNYPQPADVPSEQVQQPAISLRSKPPHPTLAPIQPVQQQQQHPHLAEREAVSSADHQDPYTRSQGSPSRLFYSITGLEEQSILPADCSTRSQGKRSSPSCQQTVLLDRRGRGAVHPASSLFYSITRSKKQSVLTVYPHTRPQERRSSPDPATNHSTRSPPRPSDQSALNQTT